MKNKVFKYIKVLVSAILILGLIAPTYASLSASDGSAFVTKAEFDSALADFNARLTTFEAGINSKIDSQVTSYLDRNGIWNGKQATFFGGLWGTGYYVAENYVQDASKFKIFWDPVSGTLSQSPDFAKPWPVISAADNWGAICYNAKYNIINMPIAWDIPKAGLCFVDASFPSTVSLRDEYIGQHHTGAGYYGNLLYCEETGYIIGIGDLPCSCKKFDKSWFGTQTMDDGSIVTAASQLYTCTTVPADQVMGIITRSSVALNVSGANNTASSAGTHWFKRSTRINMGSDSKFSYTNETGFSLGAGSFVNQFFVSKGDRVWLAMYWMPGCYPAGNDDEIFYWIDVGAQHALQSVDVNVY